MSGQVLYEDGLVSITEDAVTFRNYYLNGRSRTVGFTDVREIVVKKPTVWNGKWRIWGTGTLKTWFPLDNDRPRRDRLFVMKLKTQWMNIGFTARDGEQVETILRQRGLIR